MNTRNSSKRRYRPVVENLERKQLASADFPVGGVANTRAGIIPGGAPERISGHPPLWNRERYYHYYGLACLRSLMSRAGLDLIEEHAINGPGRVNLDGSAQLFDRFRKSLPALRLTLLTDADPALPGQHLAKKAEILGVFRRTFASLFGDQRFKQLPARTRSRAGRPGRGPSPAGFRPVQSRSPPFPRDNEGSAGDP